MMLSVRRLCTVVAVFAAMFVWLCGAPSLAQNAPRQLPQAQSSNDSGPRLSNDGVDDEIVNGTQVLVGDPGRSRRPAGTITLNYPNVDVHDVAKSILGDLLGLNYAVDQSVSGTVTVVTAEPVTKRDVLPVFESALKASNLALIKQGNVYTIVALAEARKQARLVSGSEGGYGTEAVQLHYVNPTELKKILDPMVPENGILQADPGRNVLFVTGTGAERSQMRDLIRQFDVNWMRGMSFAIFVPRNSDARSLVAELDAMINQPGSPAASVVRLYAIERINAVLAITSEPQYLKDIKKWIAMLDRLGGENQRKLFVYRVQNGRSVDLAKSLSTAFGAPGGNQVQPNARSGPTAAAPMAPAGYPPIMPNTASTTDNNVNDSAPGDSQVTSATTLSLGSSENPVTISSDETNNAVLVFATARQYAIVQDALAKLDIPPLQVVIEASIIEVTLNNNLRYGVQWFFQSGSSQGGISQGKTSVPVQDFPGFSYVFARNNVNVTLNALSDVTTIKVISAPRLLVLNNHTASMQVGDQVPVATQSSVSSDNPSAPIVNSIEYRDTGVILKVTPRVNDSGLVLLDIAQEVSDVSTTASSSIDSPTIQQRRIASSVAVKDGTTIALGGLIRDNTTTGSNGIPFLSQIPVIGALFGDKQDDNKRTELLVLLTPRVIRNSDDAVSATQELIEKLKATKPLLPK